MLSSNKPAMNLHSDSILISNDPTPPKPVIRDRRRGSDNINTNPTTTTKRGSRSGARPGSQHSNGNMSTTTDNTNTDNANTNSNTNNSWLPQALQDAIDTKFGKPERWLTVDESRSLGALLLATAVGSGLISFVGGAGQYMGKQGLPQARKDGSIGGLPEDSPSSVYAIALIATPFFLVGGTVFSSLAGCCRWKGHKRPSPLVAYSTGMFLLGACFYFVRKFAQARVVPNVCPDSNNDSAPNAAANTKLQNPTQAPPCLNASGDEAFWEEIYWNRIYILSALVSLIAASVFLSIRGCCCFTDGLGDEFDSEITLSGIGTDSDYFDDSDDTYGPRSRDNDDRSRDNNYRTDDYLDKSDEHSDDDDHDGGYRSDSMSRNRRNQAQERRRSGNHRRTKERGGPPGAPGRRRSSSRSRNNNFERKNSKTTTNSTTNSTTKSTTNSTTKSTTTKPRGPTTAKLDNHMNETQDYDNNNVRRRRRRRPHENLDRENVDNHDNGMEIFARQNSNIIDSDEDDPLESTILSSGSHDDLDDDLSSGEEGGSEISDDNHNPRSLRNRSNRNGSSNNNINRTGSSGSSSSTTHNNKISTSRDVSTRSRNSRDRDTNNTNSSTTRIPDISEERMLSQSRQLRPADNLRRLVGASSAANAVKESLVRRNNDRKHRDRKNNVNMGINNIMGSSNNINSMTNSSSSSYGNGNTNKYATLNPGSSSSSSNLLSKNGSGLGKQGSFTFSSNNYAGGGSSSKSKNYATKRSTSRNQEASGRAIENFPLPGTVKNADSVVPTPGR